MSIYNPNHDSKFYFPEPFGLDKRLKDVLEDETDTKYYLNPNKVSQFVKDNMAMIEKYIRESDEPMEKLPGHLRKWLDEYPEDTEQETAVNDAESPDE